MNWHQGLPSGLQGIARGIERDTSVNCRAPVWVRIDGKGPIHERQTLFHADEAKSMALLYRFTIKACSGIPHTKVNFIRRSRQAHYEAFCTAVFCRIVESFLQDSEQAERNVRPQRTGYIIASEVNLHVLLLAEFPAEALHGGGDSQIFQSCGVQFMRQRLGIGSNLNRLLF